MTTGAVSGRHSALHSVQKLSEIRKSEGFFSVNLQQRPATLEQITFSLVVFKLSNRKCRTTTRAVSSRSERPFTVWALKLGLGKKIFSQYVVVIRYYLVNCEEYMW